MRDKSEKNKKPEKPVPNTDRQKQQAPDITNIKEYSQWLYTSDTYVDYNPSLFSEHTPWKLEKIVPLVDLWMKQAKENRTEVAVLDVGGGTGLILKEVANRIEQLYHRQVQKYALDLSPKMLEIQQYNNPDLIKGLNEDICRTSLGNKTIDLTLMIDVLEHIPDPTMALQEVRRISRYAILKVPLEDNFINNLFDLISRGRRRADRQRLGHVNTYTTDRLKRQIETYLGKVLCFSYSNVFEFNLNSDYAKMPLRWRLINRICTRLYHVAPRLSSWISTDYGLVVVQCD